MHHDDVWHGVSVDVMDELGSEDGEEVALGGVVVEGPQDLAIAAVQSEQHLQQICHVICKS